MWSHKTGSRRGQVVARPVLTVCENKAADQPAESGQLISVVVFCYIGSAIPLLPKSVISNL